VEPLQEKVRPKEGSGYREGEGTGRYDREGDDTGNKNISKSRSSEKPGYLDRQRIFDPGEIEAVAKKDVSGKSQKDQSITFDTTDYKYAGYMGLLRSKIEGSGCWVYPREAATGNIYGDLFIRFNIMKDGSLGEVRLLRTSGHKLLDDAALKAVRDCGPYWPLPDSWKMSSYPVTGHFVYSLYGAYLR